MGPVESLKYFIPELIILCGAFGAFFLDFAVKNKRAVGIFSLFVLAAAAFAMKNPAGGTLGLFYGFFHLDVFAHWFRIFALIAVSVTLMLAMGYPPLKNRYEGEFYGLFLFMAFALITVAAANNLLMIFLAVEFVSLLSYLLTGFLKHDPKAKEAAVKYLLFGSVCSGIMLYGISLLYGAAGSIELGHVWQALKLPSMNALGTVGVLCFFAGLGFKISMAPFHMWAPDVYEGAPTPVTAFLTVGPKALGFAVLTRVLITVFSPSFAHWGAVLAALSMLTMTIGNLTAISQTNIKRFFAYSSIAQAGYILMGLAVFSPLGQDAMVIYLFTYLFTNLGAFAAVCLVEGASGKSDISDYSGLSERSPATAFFMTVFLLSLTGIPPLAGFIGKYYVFAAAIEGKAIALAVVAAVNSAVAAYYYFRIIRVMYLVPKTETQPAFSKTPLYPKIALWLMSAGVVTLGLFPGYFIKLLFG